MIRLFLVAASGALLCGLLPAQSPQAPVPEPEARRLEYFAGTWDFRLEMKPSAFGSGGLVTGTDRNAMLPGSFFLVRRYETKSPVGEFRGLEVLGWDAAAKQYLEHGFDNRGQSHLYRGTVEGGTWTFTYDIPFEGRSMKGRIVLKELSPTLQSYRSDVSEDGKTWTTVLEGEMTKIR